MFIACLTVNKCCCLNCHYKYNLKIFCHLLSLPTDNSYNMFFAEGVIDCTALFTLVKLARFMKETKRWLMKLLWPSLQIC